MLVCIAFLKTLGNLGRGMGVTSSRNNTTSVTDFGASRTMSDAPVNSGVTILLLGTSDSGKSTVLKQLKKCHAKGFRSEEVQAYRTAIHGNIISFIKILINATIEHSDLTGPIAPTLEAEKTALLEVELDGVVLTPELGASCKLLWKDSAIQCAMENRSKLKLDGDPIYFLSDIDRFSAPAYFPTDEDIIHCRQVTRGIAQISFDLKGSEFTVIDVGGQRTERRKWIHHFDTVDAIIFLTSLSEYDQNLMEDSVTNRSQEALVLFKSIIKSNFFKNATILLFLNKCDLLKKKIKKVDLNVAFKDYTGGKDYKKALEYMQGKYETLGLRYRKDVPNAPNMYTHVTCATDTKQIRFVFDACTDSLLNKALLDCGLE